ncbi:hypothetical protein KRE47_10905 [Elizabethkingia meningoseptica]|uniref:hypothetical protein n=1 Tax=Elizabethkingia meningoseptica TaxID=238 RepID=UPI0009990ADF|nr:hypothetical protein [Elizabethkingia meningoseptica]MDE5468648.1 hypothetical protein [Elizabethkingia meningoseptica]MDE5475960.1 hypothetical protein [Elizabethkingia meningoseptica]MDE5478895.1 hypothetical protein [Elizabethkingia meningoseptica]MDE5484844.1 hypothetical protein [Elizabethkingia meningoseptica]MDE5502296.1 hypothetical protein [Elizabethkingia meningoseptica]
MIHINEVTVYPFLLHTETVPFSTNLKINFYQGYTAMFWGKIPCTTSGKKYAIIEDMVFGKRFTINDWTPELRLYFEQNKARYKTPFRIRFGWLYILLGTIVFIVALFTLLILYLMIINKK